MNEDDSSPYRVQHLSADPGASSAKPPKKLSFKHNKTRNISAVVFILIFAALGGKLLFNSFASPVSSTKIWNTNAEWNTGSLNNTSVANNLVSLNSQSYSSVDLALNRPAVASSTQTANSPGVTGSVPASNAFDGNLSTRWSSNFSDPQWIYVDLGGVYNISSVTLNWETAYGKAFQIQVSDNATSWTTIYSTTSGTGGIQNLTGLSGSGRYVRMYGTARGTQWGYSLYEMAVYGSPTPTTNIALDKPAVASSTQAANSPGVSGSVPAADAFDGNLSTRWSSNFSDPQWIYVDLGSEYSINEVKLNWEAAYGKAYQIQVSNDATNWTTIYSTTTGTGGVNDLAGLSGTGRYVRMYGTARGTQWGYSLYEMSVYGTLVGAYQSSGTITLDYDASTAVDWTTLTPIASLPSGTNITYQVRTSSDNSTWSAWTSDITQAASSRYIQIQATLSTTNPAVTPTLSQLTLGYNSIVTTPTVTLSASPQSVTSGQPSTITWNSTNTSSCTASGAWSGAQGLSGSVSTGNLTATSTYSISCTGSGGTVTASATVTVTPASTGTGGTGGGGTTSSSCSSPFVESVFCMPVTNAALDSNSATLVSDFVGEIKTSGYNVGVNNGDFGIPIYRVSASQPLVTVTADCASSSDYTTSLQAPVPSGAQPASGTDHSIIIYQASTGKEWEFWEFQSTGTNSYEACDGGEIPNVATSNGVFPTSGSQVASSGIDYLATIITENDVASGSINHALAIDLIQCNGFIPPARSNYDCGDGAIPYGQYFRFPSSLAMPSGLSPLAQMIFKAIQNYGMVPTDYGGALQIAAEDPTGYQADGNSGDPITTAMDSQAEYEVIANLPWSQLQAVQEP